MGHLALVEVVELGPVQPAAMYEREAAKYLKLSVNDLRRFATDGRIVARRHPGRSRRIYLRTDLDRYLESLPQEAAS